MNSDFYKDMAQRVNTIALFGKLFMLLRSRARSLESFGFERQEDQILVVFLLLRVVMEKTLSEELCTLDDMAAALSEMNADLFHLSRSYSEFRELAALIVDKIVSNEGESIVFQAFGREEYEVPLNYLSSRVVYESDSPRVSYSMTDDGFKLMLSTLEMEENMQLQFRDMIFQMQLKRKNYSRALDEIRHIFDILKIRRLEIQERMTTVKKDALIIDPAGYREMIQENYEIMTDSRNRFGHYEKQVEEQLRLLKEKQADSSLELADFENLQTLRRIKEMLGKSIISITEILTALTDFSNLFSQELTAQFRANGRRSYSFTRLVMDPVLENPDLLEKIEGYLKPLFAHRPGPVFQLSHAFEYRQLITKNEEEDLEEVDEEYDRHLEEERKALRKQKRDNLNRSVFMLTESLLNTPGHVLSLQEFGQPENFLPDPGHARQLLSEWSMTSRVDLAMLKEDASDLVLEAEIPFSFSLSLLENYHRLPGLGDYDLLTVRKIPGKVRYGLSEDGIDYELTMDNLEFALHKNEDRQSEYGTSGDSRGKSEASSNASNNNERNMMR